MVKAIDREIALKHSIDILSDELSDGINRYEDGQGQEAGNRAVLILDLRAVLVLTSLVYELTARSQMTFSRPLPQTSRL